MAFSEMSGINTAGKVTVTFMKQLESGTANDPNVKKHYLAAEDNGEFTLYLKEAPQVNVSTKWEDAGGAKLMDTLLQFTNPDIIKFALGAKYETPIPNGLWTPRVAKEGNHLQINLSCRIFSAAEKSLGNVDTIEPLRGTVIKTEKYDNKTFEFFKRLFTAAWKSPFDLQKTVKAAKDILNGSADITGSIGTVRAAVEEGVEGVKSTAQGAWELGKETFASSAGDREEHKKLMEQKSSSFKNGLSTLGGAIDTFVSISSKFGKPTGGAPIIHLKFTGASGGAYYMSGIDFYLENFSYTPSIQVTTVKWAGSEDIFVPLYYDVSLGFISRTVVTSTWNG